MSDAQRSEAFRQHFYRQLTRLAGNGELTDVGKARSLKILLLDLFEKATERDRLHFTTNYARISYAAHKYGIPGVHVYQERRFRQRKPERLTEEQLRGHLTSGYRVATELIRIFYGGPVPPQWVDYLTTPYPFPYEAPKVRERFARLRVYAIELDTEARELYVREEARPEQVYTIPYALDRVRNPFVQQAVRIIESTRSLPILLNLLSAEIRQDGLLYSDHIVVEPDYLIDVTAVASSFESVSDYQPWTSLAKKLAPQPASLPLVRGTLVNDFLDRLIEKPDTSFRELLPTIFRSQPLKLCCFNDDEVRKLIEQLKHHFLSLRHFVKVKMAEHGLDREKIMLEPSFLSPVYGVQGRLDLLQLAEAPGESTSIVELKTSKYWRQNKYGLNQTNYIQTLLYDFMITEALGEGANVRSYILYSNDYAGGMKYAPVEAQQRQEAVAARNQIMGVELLLQTLGKDPDRDLAQHTDGVVGRLSPSRFKSLSRFSEQDHTAVLGAYEFLNALERRYYGAFLGFNAREQRLAKTGEQGLDGTHGLASLWLDEREDKIERFELLDGLRFVGYDVDTALLTLGRADDDERIVKFRQGDIIALYSTPEAEVKRGDAIRGRVHKATIASVTPRFVTLRLRNQQLNDGVFSKDRFFAIEKDVMDSGFRNAYRGLHVWAAGSQQMRKRWLGLDPPAKSDPYPERVSPALTDEQDGILRRIITAPDYFLLWGPPGTGKTSKMLHHLVEHLLANTNESILLVAYTNRAVDEICESIERIERDGEPFRDYLRIGSRYGAAEPFQDRLLQLSAEQVSRRKDLVQLIKRTRVFVGTVASVGGKDELFALKQFDRIVVDEASQILEPLLAGLLPRAPRGLLIGDHRQLPAVVQQSREDSLVRDEELRKIGLKNLANSLFERLYLTAQRKGWSWAYAQLSHQGRMHADIMAFPAEQFYGGGLKILPSTIPYHLNQLNQLGLSLTGMSALSQRVGSRRVVYLPTEPDATSTDPKVNGHEARKMVELINAFHDIYKDTGVPIEPGDIGIITPYRAQIAHIRRELLRNDLNTDDYLVDTVERYQGGARRIILISLCTNRFDQIRMLSQLSDEGVDRKLNVAMTRAREHLVIVGCEDILRQSEVYDELLDFISSR